MHSILIPSIVEQVDSFILEYPIVRKRGRKNHPGRSDYYCRCNVKQKIYFAGSIRGGRNDARLYKRIIEYIARTDKVLTEHIGNAKVEDDEKSMTDRDIYEQDTAWLRECDLVIAECTNASLGVGYEMAYAERHKKPVHIFYDNTRTRLSAMLSGDPYFHLHPYSNEEELFQKLSDILE